MTSPQTGSSGSDGFQMYGTIAATIYFNIVNTIEQTLLFDDKIAKFEQSSAPPVTVETLNYVLSVGPSAQRNVTLQHRY